jgi:hypothetical protein
MNPHCIRTDDQRVERKRLIEFNRQKRAEKQQEQIVFIYSYVYI